MNLSAPSDEWAAAVVRDAVAQIVDGIRVELVEVP